jgi:pimeloyl-ACP methyl ester carboxylesterase
MPLELISRLPEVQTHETPLLFVHGAWHGAWYWDEHFLPYFAAHGYAAHALSLRGHGGSGGSCVGARAADYVTDVRRAVERLGQPPVLIGHSLGGFIVQHTLRYVMAAAGVLLASIPPHGALRFAMQTIRQQPLDALRATVSGTLHPFVDTPQKVRQHFYSANLPEAMLARYAGLVGDESWWLMLDVALLDLPLPAQVRCPMLVLGGTNDAVFNMDEIQATARAYKTEAILFPNMAHNLMLETQWKMVADTILAFLREEAL